MVWAWVELNYRPHAYQAASYEHELGSEVPTRLPFTNILLSFSRIHEHSARLREHFAHLNGHHNGHHRHPGATELVHFRDFFSSSNQFSTTIMLSGDFVSSGRIIRNRRSSRATAYCGVNRADAYPAAGKSIVERPTANVRPAFIPTATRLPEAS